jgi:L-amino acid N-acyltransferase YncA
MASEPAWSGRYTMSVRVCVPADGAAIARIYNHYIAATVVTFEEGPVAADEMIRRIVEVTARHPWLVWEEAGEVVGYAYAAPWKSRSAYRHAVESAIYLDHAMTGRGTGTRLYAALIAELRAMGVHCVVGGVSLPNAASIALHERLGFTRVGEFREIGFKLGRWVNVGYWQLVFGAPGAPQAEIGDR